MLEPLFHSDSYGYRPGRSAIDAVRSARQLCWRYDWVLDLDIKSFLLLKAVCKHTDCPWVLLYIERWLKAPAMRDNGMLGLRERGSTGDLSTDRGSHAFRVAGCRSSARIWYGARGTTCSAGQRRCLMATDG